MRIKLIGGLCLFPLFASAQPLIKPVQLTTEFRSNPVGIAAPAPIFAWTLESTIRPARNVRQVAYRIRLASTVAELQHHPLWDSGRIASATYWQRPYEGPPLASHTTYFWQVQASSDDKTFGPWSGPAQFTTALLSEADWTAHWIAAEPDRPLIQQTAPLSTAPLPLPVFRHDFAIHKPIASALLFVAGLGQYEVHLNGHNVTDTVLSPGWTNYRKTVFYDTYDVGKLLNTGPNAVGVLLGNGMYNVQDVKGHYTKFAATFGQPKCILQLEVRYTDGTSARFTSDHSWQTHPGPIVFSSTFGGESFDARALPVNWDHAGVDTRDWTSATEVSGPGGELTAARGAPLVVAHTYRPVHTTVLKPGVTIYDLGENMSGWPSITVSGPSGSTVSMIAGELLNRDGTVSQRSANAFPDDPVLFTYTLSGNAVEHWHPRFAYYSFRYVQVTTTDDVRILSLAGDFVHAQAAVVGQFVSSNELFQRIHVLIDRAVLSNLASVVTDCPSREKLGWLEQTYLNAATLMLNYDVTGLYEKMSGDMRDSQLSDGLVPSIAPEFVAFVDDKGRSNAFRDSPEWGSASILSPWALYRYTGDSRPLISNYSSMKSYAAYLKTHAGGELLNYGLGDWYDIGPRAPGPSQLTSKYVTATGVYYEDLTTLAAIATLLGHGEDAAAYTREAAAVRDAFNNKLFHPETNQYDHGSQTANAVPLALGMVPPDRVSAVLDHLVADIHEHNDHVTAGDVGFHYVVRALTDYGRSDVLAAMFSRTDSPSYGYQLAQEATTLTEAWDASPISSQNHFMLGHGEEWFYRGLAGLTIDMARGPDEAISLQPSFLQGIPEASASFRAPMGTVALYWKQSPTVSTVDITVPVGATAKLRLPSARSWMESGIPATRSEGVLHSSAGPNSLDLSIGSGTYRFVRKAP